MPNRGDPREFTLVEPKAVDPNPIEWNIAAARR